MPHSPIVRWGLVLPLAAVALAFFLGLDDHVQSILSSLSPSSRQTYCYEGVRTSSLAETPATTCFTVQDGKFVEVSASREGQQASMQDGYAYPGLWDGHGHLLQYGEFLHSVDLFGSESFDEVKGRLLGYLDNNPGVGGPEEWIRGVGWDQMALGGMPTAVRLLDLLDWTTGRSVSRANARGRCRICWSQTRAYRGYTLCWTEWTCTVSGCQRQCLRCCRWTYQTSQAARSCDSPEWGPSATTPWMS